jgi:acyl-coenzyme A synthetase/AMP-(fatty) acid ligase
VALDILSELPKGPTGKILRRELRGNSRGMSAKPAH